MSAVFNDQSNKGVTWKDSQTLGRMQERRGGAAAPTGVVVSSPLICISGAK